MLIYGTWNMLYELNEPRQSTVSKYQDRLYTLFKNCVPRVGWLL